MSRRRTERAPALQLAFDLGPQPADVPLGELEVIRLQLDRRSSNYIEVRIKRVAEGWLRGHAYSLPIQGSHCGPFTAMWRQVHCSRACALARECDRLIESMEGAKRYSVPNSQVQMANKALAWLRELRAPLSDPCPDPPRFPYRPRGVTREQWKEEREQTQRRWEFTRRWAERDAQRCAECGVAREQHYQRWNPDQPPDPGACGRFAEPEEAATA